jgi:hypothetical protein
VPKIVVELNQGHLLGDLHKLTEGQRKRKEAFEHPPINKKGKQQKIRKKKRKESGSKLVVGWSGYG